MWNSNRSWTIGACLLLPLRQHSPPLEFRHEFLQADPPHGGVGTLGQPTAGEAPCQHDGRHARNFRPVMIAGGDVPCQLQWPAISPVAGEPDHHGAVGSAEWIEDAPGTMEQPGKPQWF